MSIPSHLLEKVRMQLTRGSVPEPNTGCILWMGGPGHFGYGMIRIGKKTDRPHRVSYMVHNGKIPKGAYICHKCHTPACINPDHLYSGDAKTNGFDKVNGGNDHNLKKTHCKFGHEFNEKNTYLRKDKKGRGCRICTNSRDRAARAKKSLLRKEKANSID